MFSGVPSRRRFRCTVSHGSLLSAARTRCSSWWQSLGHSARETPRTILFEGDVSDDDHSQTRSGHTLSGSNYDGRAPLPKSRLHWKIAVLLAIATVASQRSISAAGISLGTAGNFGVLAGSTVTNTGPSLIDGGHVGVSPGSAITGITPANIGRRSRRMPETPSRSSPRAISPPPTRLRPAWCPRRS